MLSKVALIAVRYAHSNAAGEMLMAVICPLPTWAYSFALFPVSAKSVRVAVDASCGDLRIAAARSQWPPSSIHTNRPPTPHHSPLTTTQSSGRLYGLGCIASR